MMKIVVIAGLALFAVNALKITGDAKWTTETVSESESEHDDQVAQVENRMLMEADQEDGAEITSKLEAEMDHDAEAEVNAEHEAETDATQEIEDKADLEQDQEEEMEADTPGESEQVNLQSDDQWIQYVKKHIDVDQLKEMMADSPCEMQVSAKCEGQKDEEQCLQREIRTCKHCEATRAGHCYPEAAVQLHNDCESSRPMCRMGSIFKKDASKYDQFNLGSKDKAGALAWWSKMNDAFCLDSSWESSCQH